jgi:hypothetical protein
MLRAGFAEVDISPPIGTTKIGWLRHQTIERVLDPIYARAVVIEADASGGGKVGFIALDTLSVRWTTTRQIRERIEREWKFPGQNVMVSATHNHGGPAVATAGEAKRDDRYVATLIDKCVALFGEALRRREPAQIGFASVFEFSVARNRRVVQRDGTTRCHGRFSEPGSLYTEGPIDPEVGVLAVQSLEGKPLGVLTNFACHPAHLGGDDQLTAGWPGVFAREMKARGWPVPLFLQGAAGEMHTSDPETGMDLSMEEAGKVIAEDTLRAIADMEFRDTLPGVDGVGATSTTVQLPHRKPRDGEVEGTIRGAQRFVDSAIYDRGMPALLERIRRQPLQPAEVQAIFLGEHALVSIPAEYFVQFGLRIKEATHPRHTWVVAYTNGMVGYVPTQEAMRRGGYETTFAGSSRLAPEAGDLLADAAIALVNRGLTDGSSNR